MYVELGKVENLGPRPIIRFCVIDSLNESGNCQGPTHISAGYDRM